MQPGNSSSMSNGADKITKDEVELYDRQIRLWGMDAQNKLRASSVLVFGLSGLGAEVVKNLMLCGLKSLTIMDDQPLMHDDIYANFLIAPNTPIGTNRALASEAKTAVLNPMVELRAVESSLESLLLSPAALQQYTLIVLIDQPYALVEKCNALCRQLSIKFMAGSVFGWVGFSFLDFNGTKFQTKIKQIDLCDLEGGGGSMASGSHQPIELDTERYEKLTYSYPSFKEAFNVEWGNKKYLRKSKRVVPPSYFIIRAFLRAQEQNTLTGEEEKDMATIKDLIQQEITRANQQVDENTYKEEQIDHYFPPQLSPVCAIVGGFMGQEGIKALTEMEHPQRNIFIYSEFDTAGFVCHFPPA